MLQFYPYVVGWHFKVCFVYMNCVIPILLCFYASLHFVAEFCMSITSQNVSRPRLKDLQDQESMALNFLYFFMFAYTDLYFY